MLSHTAVAVIVAVPRWESNPGGYRHLRVFIDLHALIVGTGEQSDTLRLLRLNDRKSRHRRIKKQRRYERLAATSQLSLW